MESNLNEVVNKKIQNNLKAIFKAKEVITREYERYKETEKRQNDYIEEKKTRIIELGLIRDEMKKDGL
jgi:cation transport regulator ChaB